MRWLGMAAAGHLPGSAVLSLLGLQIPLLLGALLPAALYLSFLLAYGRLYVDHEMVVLMASGISRLKLLGMSLLMALCVAALVSVFMFWVNPKIMAYKEKLVNSVGTGILLQTILPGRFQEAPDGNAVYYVQKMHRNRQHAYNVFMASRAQKGEKSQWDIVSGAEAHQKTDKKTGDQFLVIKDGYRYFGDPGKRDYRVIHFQQYGINIPKPTVKMSGDPDAMPTSQVWGLALGDTDQRFDAMGELQWRIAMPLSALLLTLLAVPLSRVSPRQGKFAQLLPAIIIYIIYANFMFIARDWLEESKTPFLLGLWWVHGLLLCTAFSVWWYQSRDLKR